MFGKLSGENVDFSVLREGVPVEAENFPDKAFKPIPLWGGTELCRHSDAKAELVGGKAIHADTRAYPPISAVAEPFEFMPFEEAVLPAER